MDDRQAVFGKIQKRVQNLTLTDMQALLIPNITWLRKKHNLINKGTPLTWISLA